MAGAADRRVTSRRIHPARIIAGGFAGVIAMGTALLSLPAATANGTSIPLIDAMFTAVSATCVTGLTVVDTGTVFSRFGQAVILACIQIGGLGLMTMTTVFLVAFGRRLAIVDRIAMQDSFHHTRNPQLGALIKYIVAATFATEGLGAAILSIYWIATGRFESPWTAVYHAVFHAVSAFCNAGFALYRDNLTGFQSDPVVLMVISGLIITGGLGFLVGLDVTTCLRRSSLLRFSTPGRLGHSVSRLSLHSKLVLNGTAALLAAGMVSYYLLERRALFARMGEFEAWLNAFFCSVTARTAGFNTIDYAGMSSPALLCTIVLMFIGASPGSTGGGIKTSTFVLLIAYAYSRWRGSEDLHVFNRRVPQETLDKAQSVVFAALATFVLGGSALVGIESTAISPAGSHDQFLSLIFETTSAMGTVGLSMGQTPLLSAPGKLILMLLMFMGRVGPLTMALAISIRRTRSRFRYADENVMVG
ncbi:MAG: Trk family potassium uptake protein [Bryobacteraceae bacterium]|nr:TrkH family potassium uptake protein [Bryobacterales bacterium]NUN02456.1 Trk family potassium uptake protein [Bryobacteraceae bacterium]